MNLIEAKNILRKNGYLVERTPISQRTSDRFTGDNVNAGTKKYFDSRKQEFLDSNEILSKMMMYILDFGIMNMEDSDSSLCYYKFNPKDKILEIEYGNINVRKMGPELLKKFNDNANFKKRFKGFIDTMVENINDSVEEYLNETEFPVTFSIEKIDEPINFYGKAKGCDIIKVPYKVEFYAEDAIKENIDVDTYYKFFNVVLKIFMAEFKETEKKLGKFIDSYLKYHIDEE